MPRYLKMAFKISFSLHVGSWAEQHLFPTGCGAESEMRILSLRVKLISVTPVPSLNQNPGPYPEP